MLNIIDSGNYMKKLLFLSLLTVFALGLHGDSKPITQTADDDDGPGFWSTLLSVFLPHAEHRKALYKKQSKYFLITVERDYLKRRHLVFLPRKGSQGVWDPAKPEEIISGYCRFMTLFMPMLEKPPKRVLFIGLGCGIGPRFIRKYYQETMIDIVEIDEAIPVVAKKYFGFKKDDKMHITIGDGRFFINRTKNKYDAIFIDAYNAESIPFQLTTQEFYRKVKDALTPNGIMNANIANLGKEEFIASELKTVQSIFPGMAVYDCNNESNYVLFARKNGKLDNKKLIGKAKLIQKKIKPELDMADMLEERMDKDDIEDLTEDGKILTDDFAPVENMK